jgi:hypothetical protein
MAHRNGLGEAILTLLAGRIQYPMPIWKLRNEIGVEIGRRKGIQNGIKVQQWKMVGMGRIETGMPPVARAVLLQWNESLKEPGMVLTMALHTLQDMINAPIMALLLRLK